MVFSLLSYNTLYNRAYYQIEKIIKEYRPDILCLQEIDTKENNLKLLNKYGYRVADYANCFIEFGKIWGIVTFYNSDKFEFVNSKPIQLINGFYEIIKLIIRLFKNKGIRRTILKTNLRVKGTSKIISVYNLHLSAFGLNNLRIKQLNMLDFNNFDHKDSVIITGDFNFPIERKKLESIMDKYQLKEATNNLFYTVKYPGKLAQYPAGILYRLFAKIIRRFWTDEVKLDYIFYKGLKNISTQRLDYYQSDHFPIIAKFEI